MGGCITLMLSIRRLLYKYDTARLRSHYFPVVTIISRGSKRVSFNCKFPGLDRGSGASLRRTHMGVTPIAKGAVRDYIRACSDQLRGLTSYGRVGILIFKRGLVRSAKQCTSILSCLGRAKLFPEGVCMYITRSPLTLFRARRSLPRSLKDCLRRCLRGRRSTKSKGLFGLNELLSRGRGRVLRVVLPCLRARSRVVF